MLSAESGMEDVDFVPVAESMPAASGESKTNISMEGGTETQFQVVDIKDHFVALENNL